MTSGVIMEQALSSLITFVITFIITLVFDILDHKRRQKTLLGISILKINLSRKLLWSNHS